MSDAFNQMLAQGPTPIKFADPINQMAQLMQLKNAQQTGVVNQMAIDKGQRALDTENAVKALYAGGATPTTNQLFAVSPEAGAAARTAEGVANTQASTIAANQAKTAKLEQESRNYKIIQYGNVLRSLDALPESERNAIYLNMIPHLAENLGPEVAASFPPAYDSKRIAALLGRSEEILTADQQAFDNEIKNRQVAASEMSAAAARDRAANGGAANKPPVGYEPNPKIPGALRFTPGGPADPAVIEAGRVARTSLKSLPSFVSKAIQTNKQNLRVVDWALTLLSGKNVGELEGDSEALGAKTLLPPLLQSRFDPKGVPTRAAVGDLESMIVHDRSGAAVPASEQPRLKPFLPIPGEKAEETVKKLKRFRQIYNEIQADYEEAYSEDTGYNYKPGGAGATPPPAAGDPKASVERKPLGSFNR